MELRKNNLRKYRCLAGYSLQELGDKTGYSKALLSNTEKNNIQPKKAQKLADFLNVNVFELLGESALVMLPKTKTDKEALLKVIERIEVEE